MRPFVLTRCLALLAPLLSAVALAQPNLVANGDFEGRYQAPRGTNNIGLVTGSTPTTDLQDWYRTPTSTSTNPISNYPDYVATDGVPSANPATYFSANYPRLNINYSFAPHAGQSCVVLYQHNVNGDHRNNSIITRQLSSALIPGHRYRVNYWVRRLASDQYRTELALYVTNSAPTFDGGYQYSIPSTTTFSPSPGNKLLLSGDIRDTQNWTQVSGIITPNDQGNQWVTIGYAATNQQYDSSIPGYNAPGIYYAIDDVSITDITCASPIADAYQDFSVGGNCTNVAGFVISNYDPAITYTFTRGYGNPTIIYGGRGDRFNVKVGGFQTPYGATFTMTATNSCGISSTSDELAATYPCEPATPIYRTANATTAYPNPASEALTVPDGVESAILLNSAGKPVQVGDKSGKLDVQSIPEGLYNLQMMQNGKLTNQRIQVKH
jgi:hypothetical protein